MSTINYLFLGNPGTGKSTLINCLIGKAVFCAGVNYGGGLTESFQKYTHDGVVYMDTPGLADRKLKKHAATAITQALRQSGRYKLFFMVRLENGRVVADDLATIETVMNSIDIENVPFSVIINNVKKRQYAVMMEKGFEFVKVMTLVNAISHVTPRILFIPTMPDLDEEDNAIARLPGDVEAFIRYQSPSVTINPEIVSEIKPDEFSKLLVDLRDRLEQLRNDNTALDRRLEELQAKTGFFRNVGKDTDGFIHSVINLSHNLRRYEWFISQDDVELEDETIGQAGTFAEARRGTWLHDGERQDVVVKTLHFNTDGEGAEDFLNQLVFWYKLPPHDNVLKLRGGNHVSSPPFFVCEDAHNGNLVDFLGLEENRKHFWSLFLDVARGLKYLHQQNIVHGGLKGTNILVGDDNTAKIADFGFSCLRSASLRLSDKGSKALSASIRWKAKELLAEAAPDEPRFEADVYALGMCMVEAITQEIPFGMTNDDDVAESVVHGELPPRPEQAPEGIWDFICSLCAEDYHARPNIDEVITTLKTNLESNTPYVVAGARPSIAETLDTLSTPNRPHPPANDQPARDRRLFLPSPRTAQVSTMPSFPIVGLNGSPSSTQALKALSGRCYHTATHRPEIQQLCKQVVIRLQLIHDDVANAEDDKPRAKYCDVIVRFGILLRCKPLLLRLASSETIVLTIRGLHEKISEVAQWVGRADTPELNKWHESWDEDQTLQLGKLKELVTGASNSMLVKELRGDNKVREALMALNSGISRKSQSPEMLELKKMTLARVSRFLHLEELLMFDWFIPIDDVECEDEAIGHGTLGKVCPGIWLHDGERTEVAVKLLFAETLSDLDDAFLRQLQLWRELPESKFILKLYGGSHVSTPHFYVCENAPNGNIAKFLEDEAHGVLFWRLFRQVAEGIKFLHDMKLVHGGLKCNNILVGADCTPKLADFGFSTVRMLSAGISIGGRTAITKSVRWKAKEVIKESAMDAPRYESDIYSLAMCMIEAKNHEPPFGMLDDGAAMDAIMKGETHPRPDGKGAEISDDEWAFISRLSNPNYKQRPSIDQVLEEIKVFADAEEKLQQSRIELIDSFISLDDLEFDDGPIVAGTLDEVRRAMWLHDGKSDKVVVKQLIAPLSGAASDAFTRQLNAWHKLPVHPNILQLHGGCNVGPLQFYVCEEVCNGSLADYCRTPRSSVLIWKMLIQVAEGLEFLQDHGIIHGGLMCNNILLGEDNVPKLSDFGFSSISHFSMDLGASHRSQSEDGSMRKENFESDILALGRCIAEALKQTIPFVNGGPDTYSSSIQRVVSNMCASNHRDRPTIRCTLAEMRNVFPSQPMFPMYGLLGSPPSQKTLTTLARQLQRMPENEMFLRHLLERLQFLHDPVTPLAVDDPLKLQYIEVVGQLVNLMRRQPLLQRLARCEMIVTGTRVLHLKLSEIGQSLGLGDEPAMNKFRQEWDADQGEQFRTISQAIIRVSERMLVSEFQGERRAQEALIVLLNGMKRKDQLSGMSGLKQSTIDRVQKFLNLETRPAYSSFIPSMDIVYEHEPFRFGGYGEMHRGTWLCNGERKEVAIQLFEEMVGDEQEVHRFIDRLEWLSSIPDNDHILKIYGGSYLGAPPFYVYENVPSGALLEYLGDESDASMFWRLFEQAAEGLKFLHENNIVHGNLRCSSIVIGENFTVKLVDVGEAMLSRGDHARPHVEDPWNPVEQLRGEAGARREGDIYSLGMCMIEAITFEPPFGCDGDEKIVRELILKGEGHPRPEGVSDAAWTLITAMCNPAYNRRPSIDAVLEHIRELTRLENLIPVSIVLDEAEATTQTRAETPRVCACCGNKAWNLKDRYCRWCGHITQLNASSAHVKRTFENFLSKREKLISRHGLPAYLKSCQAIDAGRKLYEVAIAVQDLHREGIMHCDLKPANLFIGRDGKVHLSFEYNNLAAKFAEHRQPIPLNEALRWQSPEVLNGDQPTVMSDVYSLGMCAIFIVGGNPPWGDGLSEEEAKLQVCNGHAMPLRCQGTFTDTEWNLIGEMCDPCSENRIGLDDVIRRLAHIVGLDPVQSPEWQLSDSDVVFQDDGLFSQTQYMSRHVGRWKDAVVALETVTEQFKRENKSFTNVADLWFSLKHPTILQLFGACQERQAFVCEYTECGDLRSFLFKGNFTSSRSQIWQVLLDVALGIRYLHAIGIVHGDVGLHNILVKRSGQGKLAGFSLSSKFSHLCQDSSETAHMTESEATSETKDAGFASDVYCFGWCIVDAFCEPPLVHSKMIEARTTEPGLMQRPDVLSEEEWALVVCMCCSDPVERIEMAEVVKRLARLSGINVAIDSELSKTKILLSVTQRHTLQAMVLKEVLKYEKEEEEDERSRMDDNLDDGMYDPWAGIQRKKIKRQLKDYQPHASVNVIPTMTRISSVPPQQPIPLWRLAHTSIIETRGPGGLGSGAFASVAIGIWLGASVALKKMSKVDLDHDQSLRQETNLWFKLRHPHIVSLFGVCCGGYQLFVCDLVGGGRLDKYRSKRKEKIWGLLHDAAVGLQGLHSYGVVHADLKCDNILVTKDERVKLIDFGLSCLSTCDGGETKEAPRWKAPECLNGAGPTFASDVYSFGMCIVEAMTGQYPWGKQLPNIAVVRNVKKGSLPAQPNSFDTLGWELVKRMCCFEPEDRLQVDEVVKVLGFFAEQDPYVDDQSIQETMDMWERDPLPVQAVRQL